MKRRVAQLAFFSALLAGCVTLRPEPFSSQVSSAPIVRIPAPSLPAPEGPPPLVPRPEPLLRPEPPKEKKPALSENKPAPGIGPWRLNEWSHIDFGGVPWLLNGLPVGGFFTYEFDLGFRDRTSQLAFEDWISTRSKYRRKNYLRAGLELFIMAGPIGTTWYWANQDFNQVDWELRWDQESWKRKVITWDAVRFDTNLFETNAVGHTFQTGMWYHVFARTNRLNIFESLLFSFVTSSAWEYVSEFKELVSLNDLIMTPVAGMALGEVFFQYGEFFSRGHNKSVNRLLSPTVAAPQQFHAWLDRATIPRAGSVDRFGFPTDIAHQFEVSTGLGTSVVTGTEHNGSDGRIGFDVNTEIVTIPNYNQPVKVPWHFSLDNFTNASFRMLHGSNGIRLFYLLASMTLGGFFVQDISLEPSGRLRGVNFFAGLGSAYEYSKRFVGDVEDRLAIVNLLGPVLDFTARRAGFYARAHLGAYGDFAMVGPYPVMKFLNELDGRRTKSVLEGNRYYYAAGITVVPELSLRFRGLETGLASHFDYFRSLEGRDRFEELIEVQGVAVDFRASHRVWIAYVFPQNSMRLMLSRESIFRDSAISTFKSQSVEDLHFVKLGLLF